jgi:hypothetical protein
VQLNHLIVHDARINGRARRARAKDKKSENLRPKPSWRSPSTDDEVPSGPRRRCFISSHFRSVYFAVCSCWVLFIAMLLNLPRFKPSDGTTFGAPMKVRQERLGHSTASMTLDHYTHSVGEDHRRIAAQLGEILCPLVSKSGSEASSSSESTL